MLGTDTPPLTLAELEVFDPQAPPSDGERRFCCPLDACADKPVDSAHRSLAVNVGTGLWRCYRCQARGKLREWWAERAPSPRGRRSAALARACRLTPEAPPAAEPAGQRWRRRLQDLVPVGDTPALDYLASRGFPPAAVRPLLAEARVAYAAAWQHWAEVEGRWTCVGTDRRIAFPLRDQAGQLVGLATRAIDQAHRPPQKQTVGELKAGLFATPGALAADPLVITEAPIDALALAVCGVPALALVGTSAPRWLAQHAALRVVLVATDNDEAGDQAAAKLAAALGSLGARCERLRAARKDWAEDLAAVGCNELTAQLAVLVGSVATPPSPRKPWDAQAARALLAALYSRVQTVWPQLAPSVRELVQAVLAAHEPMLRRAFEVQDLDGLQDALTAARVALAPHIAAV